MITFNPPKGNMKNSFLFTSALFLLCLAKANAQPNVQLPNTMEVPHKESYFGVEINDPFRWLEEPAEQPDVAKWIKAQQNTTGSFMASLSLKQDLVNTLTQYWNYPKYGTPYLIKGKLVYSFNPGLLNQSEIYMREGLVGNTTLLLDPNAFSEDGTASLADMAFSKDGRFLAYAVSESGSDWKTIYVKDIHSGLPLMDSVPNVKFSGISWYGNGFIYSRFPRSSSGAFVNENTGQQVCYHTLGTNADQDQILFEDNRFPRYGKYGMVTKDEALLVLSMHSGTYGNKIEVRSLKSGLPGSNAVLLTPDFSSQNAVVWHENGKVWMQTDKDAPNQRLVCINLSDASPTNWKNSIPERNDAVLQAVFKTPKGFLAQYVKEVKSELWWYPDNSKKQPIKIQLPASGTISGLSCDVETGHIFFTLTSYHLPPTVYTMNESDFKPEVFFASECKANVSPNTLAMEQRWFTSTDGTKVPMYLLYRKDLPLEDRPVFLYGYGGFNISVMPSFSLMYWTFVQEGGVVAVPALRGGAEFGEEWHKAGMLFNKKQVFNDFISAAEYLIKEKITTPERLAIHGRSNGGLLVGACMTMRPELFKVAIPAVGVLDMLRFHKFTIGHAWMVEYGNPENEEDFKNLLSYSPLHSIQPETQYPATLVMTADHDDRVVPAHSFKFAASLQKAQTGNRPILIRIDSRAGHGAGKSTSMMIEEMADILAFTLYFTGTPSH